MEIELDSTQTYVQVGWQNIHLTSFFVDTKNTKGSLSKAMILFDQDNRLDVSYTVLFSQYFNLRVHTRFNLTKNYRPAL